GFPASGWMLIFLLAFHSPSEKQPASPLSCRPGLGTPMMTGGHSESPEGIRKFLRTLHHHRRAWVTRLVQGNLRAPKGYPRARRVTRGTGYRRARLDPPCPRAARSPDPLTRAGRGVSDGPSAAGVARSPARAPGNASPRRRA